MKPGVSCSLTHETFKDGARRERIRFGQEHAQPPTREWFDSDEIYQAVLEQHNQIRALFGAGPGWRYEGAERVAITHCPDCNTPVGGYHHPGCDQEVCPCCRLQAHGCDHYA